MTARENAREKILEALGEFYEIQWGQGDADRLWEIAGENKLVDRLYAWLFLLGIGIGRMVERQERAKRAN